MFVVDAEALEWCKAGGVVRKVFDAELEHAAALVFRGGDDCNYADRIPLRAISAGPVDGEAAAVARRGASAIKSAILIRAISRMAANNKCLAARNNCAPSGGLRGVIGLVPVTGDRRSSPVCRAVSLFF